MTNRYQSDNSIMGMKPGRFAGVLFMVIVLIALFVGTFNGLFDRNDDQNWQVVQSVGGDVEIKNDPGWYLAKFAKVWTWPKASDTEDFKGIRVTFNDGGTAELEGSIRYRLPSKQDERRVFHQEFSSNEGDIDGGMHNVHEAVIAHLVNCFKNTGPMMSGSEHQSGRKGEFYRLVNDQLKNGLFETERITTQVKDQTDENGQPITVMSTRVVLDDAGNPKIKEHSPLEQYGMNITQFSIGSQTYDDATLDQFAAKKEFFLAAEKNKAERQNMVEERLMIEERGLKDKAEVEATALKDKAKAVIEAQKRVEVAEASARQAAEQKKQAEIEAEREKSVGILNAERQRDVATLDLESAKLNAEAVKITAAAEEERIQKAGAITEKDRILAEIKRAESIGVAAALSKIPVPQTVINGGGGEGGNNSNGLMQLILLKAAGIIKDDQVKK